MSKPAVLFRGHVDGDTLVGIAYDYIGGKEVKLASLMIVRENKDSSLLITVFPNDDEFGVFPPAATILLHPESRSARVESDSTPYCYEHVKPKVYEPKDRIRRPVEQLRHSYASEEKKNP